MSVLHKCGMKLVIKLNSWNNSYYDKIPQTQVTNFSLIGKISPESIANVGTVASFNSTLLLAFCTSINYKGVCLEMHPQQLNPAFSYGICKYGVAQPIYSFEELENNLEERNRNLTPNIISRPLKSHF